MRLGILATHPVQYHSPWFRHLSSIMDVTVYYAHCQTPAEQARAGFGVEFDWDTPTMEGYEYRWLANIGHAGRTGFARFDTPELSDIIRRTSFDAFLIFGWNHKSAWQAMSACIAAGVPILMRGDSQLRTQRSPLWRVVKMLPYRFLLSRCSAHLYVGRRNREYLRHYGVPEERLFHAPHFVDVDELSRRALAARNDGTSDALRNEFGIPREAKVFLFVGKLIEKKRPMDFLSAIASFRQPSGESAIHGVVVGDGPLRPALENASRSLTDNVHFAGFVNQAAIPAHYACADALVLTSDARETWGLVVNEAAACGIPSVVSDDAGCVEDLIDDTRTGFRFETGCIESLRSAMSRQLASLNADRPGVSRALSDLSKHHSVEAATSGLLRAMERSRSASPVHAAG